MHAVSIHHCTLQPAAFGVTRRVTEWLVGGYPPRYPRLKRAGRRYNFVRFSPSDDGRPVRRFVTGAQYALSAAWQDRPEFNPSVFGGTPGMLWTVDMPVSTDDAVAPGHASCQAAALRAPECRQLVRLCGVDPGRRRSRIRPQSACRLAGRAVPDRRCGGDSGRCRPGRPQTVDSDPQPRFSQTSTATPLSRPPRGPDRGRSGCSAPVTKRHSDRVIAGSRTCG